MFQLKDILTLHTFFHNIFSRCNVCIHFTSNVAKSSNLSSVMFKLDSNVLAINTGSSRKMRLVSFNLIRQTGS